MMHAVRLRDANSQRSGQHSHDMPCDATRASITPRVTAASFSSQHDADDVEVPVMALLLL